VHKLAVLAVALICPALAAPAAAAVPTLAGQWGTQGSGPGQFSQPRSVAVDSAGNVYVADSGNSRIQKFTPQGAFVRQWGTQGAGPGQFAVASPDGLAIDFAGNVYAADRNNNRIEKFTADGAFISEFGGLPTLSAPEGVAVDSAGNVFVTEINNDRVQRFNSSGVSTLTWGTSGAATGQFESPSDITLDPSSTVYVADDGNNRIQKFTPNGSFQAAWGSLGAADGQFNSARGVGIDSIGLVMVADFQNRRIQRFSIDGTFSDKWGDATVFNRPVDVAESRDGNFYVADFFRQRILRFSEGGGGGGPTGGLPSPVLGQAVNVAAVKGTVLVAVPASGARAHASQKGLTFVPLTAARQIPTGSFLDTKRGTVSLSSATGVGTKTQSGQFTSGIFQVLQSRKKRDKGLTELRLKGSSFRSCTSRRGRRAAAAKLPRRLIRQLKANAKGRFRTRGRRSAATVRGTIWITADRCDGTLTTVKRGKVAVRDFRRKKTVIVRAGKSYLAR
jgi:sugar lactone lactonase YvrE